MKIIILAGGQGTRLWPVSTYQQPKQFAPLLGEQTMLVMAYERLRLKFALEDIYISVSKENEQLVYATLPAFPQEHVIVEPVKRDTAPAIGYVAAMLSRVCPDEPIMFVPSDHFIGDTDLFLRTIALAGVLVREHDVLVDIAVPASFPSTVLGYTKIGKRIETREGIEIYTFAGHTEKPDLATAKKYLQDSSYLWHASYFTWTPEGILRAFDQHAPDMGALLRRIATTDNTSEQVKLFSQLPKTSFDYAVVEHLQPNDVLIMKGTFGWSDLGAWDVFADQFHTKYDINDNVIFSERWIGIDTSRTLVHGTKEKIIATIGVDNLIIIDTPHALLICPKHRAQDVKKIVEQLPKDL